MMTLLKHRTLAPLAVLAVASGISLQTHGLSLPNREAQPPAQVQDFQNAVSGLESRQGAYSTQLSEQLLSLGLVLQQQGRHTDAIAAFKRGAHLARINNGLHSSEQIPHIENKIISQLALGQYAQVDQGQQRLFRIQQRNKVEGEAQDRALIQQAEWQHHAYNLGIESKETRFTRLLDMWDFYFMARADIIEREGQTSTNLLEPLYGLMQTEYLISNSPTNIFEYPLDEEANLNQRQLRNRFYSFYTKSYDRGRAIIRAIYDIKVSQYGEKSLPVTRIHIMLGDWKLWYGQHESAQQAYSLAMGELAQFNVAQTELDKLFGEPVPLPDLDGVRPLPPELETDRDGILIEFGVNQKGKVVNIARRNNNENESEDNDEATDKQARRLIRTLRETRFRPRFEDGKATDTENIVKAYAINH